MTNHVALVCGRINNDEDRQAAVHDANHFPAMLDSLIADDVMHVTPPIWWGDYRVTPDESHYLTVGDILFFGLAKNIPVVGYIVDQGAAGAFADALFETGCWSRWAVKPVSADSLSGVDDIRNRAAWLLKSIGLETQDQNELKFALVYWID